MLISKTSPRRWYLNFDSRVWISTRYVCMFREYVYSVTDTVALCHWYSSIHICPSVVCCCFFSFRTKVILNKMLSTKHRSDTRVRFKPGDRLSVLVISDCGVDGSPNGGVASVQRVLGHHCLCKKNEKKEQRAAQSLSNHPVSGTGVQSFCRTRKSSGVQY